MWVERLERDLFADPRFAGWATFISCNDYCKLNLNEPAFFGRLTAINSVGKTALGEILGSRDRLFPHPRPAEEQIP